MCDTSIQRAPHTSIFLLNAHALLGFSGSERMNLLWAGATNVQVRAVRALSPLTKRAIERSQRPLLHSTCDGGHKRMEQKMRSYVSTADLLVAFMLVASLFVQPASAAKINKKEAHFLCALKEQQQCPKKFYSFKTCSQWGHIDYAGGSLNCCMKWFCGVVHCPNT
jgi:hypothetical protein